MNNSLQLQLETILSKLVSIPSVSSNSPACFEIIEYIRQNLDSRLFITSDTDRENPWLIATTQNTKEPDVMFAAHLDVVPAESDLFTMQKRDGKLFGRGAYDMKLAAACYLTLMATHLPELRERNIGFLFTTDEEIGSPCMPNILESGWRPGIVFIPDGGDNWSIEEKAKGLYGIEITAQGKTAHGSRPWEGDNALHRLMDALDYLRKMFPHQNPNDATLAVNQVTGGRAINQIADYAEAKLDFRSFHQEDIERFRTEIQQLATKYNFETNVTQEGDPVLFNKTSPQARGFLDILTRITGNDPQYTHSFGGSDARFFAQYDIPCIIIEPYGGGRHAVDEWLLAEDLPKYFELIKQWMLSQKTINTVVS